MDDINRYLKDRIALAGDAYWSGHSADPQTIVDLAEATLSAHERFSEPLFAEMSALADSAGISRAEAVVVGGFTDLIDVVRASGGSGLIEDDCTGVIDADRGVLGQTWDMHASAGEYVYLVDVQPINKPRALVQTTAGCLGQIGMNDAGVAVGINNLTSLGRPGVTWPFVVRKILEQTSLDAAIDVVLQADLAGGHNFFLVGPDGTGCNIEAMPDNRKVTRVGEGYFAHTNHCLDASTKTEEGARNPFSEANSEVRLERAREHRGDLVSFFADPEISREAANIHDVATCGAVVMSPSNLSLKAVWGRPGDFPWEEFSLR